MSRGSVVRDDGLAADLPVRIARRYAVQTLLGRGGMGAVYRVLDEQTGKVVALKQLAPKGDKSADGLLSELFRREFRTLSDIAHPSVIRVFDFGVDAGKPYYTMAYVPGQDLHGAAPIPWRQACAQLRDVASCLSLLHARRLLHRDVSPRNVRIGAAGHAKLIDFGALAVMGPGHPIVGTPPLIPPESLHRQQLDARCDVFALGGTLYWALTGRHAFPARRVQDLPVLWQRGLPPPSALAVDVPRALDELVLAMLSRDPDGRPRSATEVIERLGAIAELPQDEHAAVSHAYLESPSLVGRDVEITRLRELLEEMGRARNRGLVLTGESGIGRTRMLDVAIMEATLVGAFVLRVSAGAATGRPLSLAHALLEAAGLPADTAADIESRHERQDSDGARTTVMQRVRGVLRQAAARGVVVVAVDDIHLADPDSQGFIASLLGVCRRRLLLIVSTVDGAAAHPALEAFVSDQERMPLRRLSDVESTTLIASVFGQAPNTDSVASQVHAVSHGNPRATLHMAQHLVDSGVIRYELGDFVLPDHLGPDDLPRSLVAGFEARLAALSSDAMDALQVLSLADAHGLGLDDLDRLTAHSDPDRRRNATDELASAGLVAVDGQRARLAVLQHREAITDSIPEARRATALMTLAECLRARGEDPIVVADCQLRAGCFDAGLDTLIAELNHAPRWDTAPLNYTDVLARAIPHCQGRAQAGRERFVLRNELVNAGEHLGLPDLRTLYLDLIEQMAHGSGLRDLEALPESMDPGERLTASFQTAQARYDGLPEHEKVLAPLDAILELTTLVRKAGAYSATNMDQDLDDRLPNLMPFAPLSLALELSVKYAQPANSHMNATRYEEAYACFGALLKALEREDRAGLPEADWRWSVAALNYGQGHLLAGFAIAEALERATLLESMPGWEVAAWDIRREYHTKLGDSIQAERCRRRMEWLQLETGRKAQFVDNGARLTLDTCLLTGDLVGMRRALDRIRPLIGTVRGFEPYEHYGPAIQALLCGNFESALAHGTRALELAETGRHPTWPHVASCVVRALIGLERHTEAISRGRALVAEAERHGLCVTTHYIALPLSLAEAHVGDTESAVARAEAAIAYRTALGCQGIILGICHEYRARVAIVSGDVDGFTTAAAACAEAYGKGRRGSSLVARYEALVASAKRAELSVPAALLESPGQVTSHFDESLFVTRLQGVEEDRRDREVLGILMEELKAIAGQLYRITASGPTLCESRGQVADHALPSAAAVMRPKTDPMGADHDVDTWDETVAAPVDQTGLGWRRVELTGTDGPDATAIVMLYCPTTVADCPPNLLELLAQSMAHIASQPPPQA